MGTTLHRRNRITKETGKSKVHNECTDNLSGYLQIHQHSATIRTTTLKIFSQNVILKGLSIKHKRGTVIFQMGKDEISFVLYRSVPQH